jgi:hypothetical protein
MAQRGICGGLLQVGGGRVRARVVADEVKVLAGGSGDAEGLLHQPVGLIPVAIGALIGAISSVLIAAPTFGRLAASGHRVLRNAATTTLALHLPIGQEAARDTTGAPGLSVRPPAHARFALIPDEHGARPNRLALFF